MGLCPTQVEGGGNKWWQALHLQTPTPGTPFHPSGSLPCFMFPEAQTPTQAGTPLPPPHRIPHPPTHTHARTGPVNRLLWEQKPAWETSPSRSGLWCLKPSHLQAGGGAPPLLEREQGLCPAQVSAVPLAGAEVLAPPQSPTAPTSSPLAASAESEAPAAPSPGRQAGRQAGLPRLVGVCLAEPYCTSC